MESASTVQLGGFERKSTYNATRSRDFVARTVPADASTEDVYTPPTSAHSSMMPGDLTCSVSVISNVSSNVGEGVHNDDIDTSVNRHAAEMQGMLDEVSASCVLKAESGLTRSFVFFWGGRGLFLLF